MTGYFVIWVVLYGALAGGLWWAMHRDVPYRALYDNSPDMEALFDYEKRTLVDCNETYARGLGYTKRELIGRTFDSFYEHVADEVERKQRLASRGELHDVELIIIRQNGERLDTSASVTILRKRGRLFAKMTLRDITSRKQIERNNQFIANIGALFRPGADPLELTLAVTAKLAKYLRSDDVFVADCNEAERLLTIRAPDVQTRSYDLYSAELLHAQRTGRIAFEQNIIALPFMRDGEWVASLVVADIKVNSWSAVERAFLQTVGERLWFWLEQDRLAREVQQARTRELVRHSEEPYRALINSVTDYGIYTLDAEGHVTSWNAGAQYLKGYSAEEILGLDFGRFYTLADRERGHDKEVLRRTVENGRYEEEGIRVRKDGSEFWANVVLTALYNPDGSLRGFAKVTRDFSARRKAEEELREKHSELAASLREREILLQEVHHRVKNNLQVVSSLINMQMRQLRDPASRAALEECKTRVETIALIHQKLYEFKDYANVPFSEYAQLLAGNIMSAGAPSNVDLRVELDPVILSVDKAIPCGLILNELITNALKHAFPEARQGALHIGLKRHDETLQLEVGDDGVGMSEDFDIAQSSSLGMRLVATLVDQLDGELNVTRDSGTTFQITFPIQS